MSRCRQSRASLDVPATARGLRVARFFLLTACRAGRYRRTRLAAAAMVRTASFGRPRISLRAADRAAPQPCERKETESMATERREAAMTRNNCGISESRSMGSSGNRHYRAHWVLAFARCNGGIAAKIRFLISLPPISKPWGALPQRVAQPRRQRAAVRPATLPPPPILPRPASPVACPLGKIDPSGKLAARRKQYGRTREPGEIGGGSVRVSTAARPRRNGDDCAAIGGDP